MITLRDTQARGGRTKLTNENVRQAAEAGYDEVYVQQIGPEQEAFFRFYENEILPKLR